MTHRGFGWEGASGWLLINLQRHADHHLRPGMRCDRLKLDAAAPRLSAGYAKMLIVALISPLWFAMMNPRANDWRDAEEPLAA